jgi:hypothetical protein
MRVSSFNASSLIHFFYNISKTQYIYIYIYINFKNALTKGYYLCMFINKHIVSLSIVNLDSSLHLPKYHVSLKITSSISSYESGISSPNSQSLSLIGQKPMTTSASSNTRKQHRSLDI